MHYTHSASDSGDDLADLLLAVKFETLVRLHGGHINIDVSHLLLHDLHARYGDMAASARKCDRTHCMVESGREYGNIA